MAKTTKKGSEPPPLILVCATTDNTGDWEFARLTIGPEYAEELLGYRKLVGDCKAVDSSFYCVEFFDYTVAWGRELNSEDQITRGEAGWLAADDERIITPSTSRTSGDTLHVTDSGVLWSASPKNTDGYFETEELEWSSLQQIVDGQTTFDPITYAE